MDEITNCDQCFNFCPIEEVRCERGRKLKNTLQVKAEEICEVEGKLKVLLT